MDFKSPTIIAALISVIGLVLLAPLVKRWLFDPVHRLRAEIAVFRAGYSTAVAAIINEKLQTLVRQDHEQWQRLYGLRELDGYATVAIRNVGKKKVTGVTVIPNVSLARMYYQIGDGPTEKIANGERIVVGDLQPRQECIVRFWSSLFFGRHFVSVKSAFQITADELDSLRVHVPDPQYISTKHEIMGRRLLFVLAGLGALAWLVMKFL